MNKSFEILAAEYRGMLASYLRALCKDPHLAEDLAQETLLTAQDRIESFDASGSFGAWLRGIGRNKALEDRRARARHPLLVDSEVVAGMEEVYSLFDSSNGTWDVRIAAVQRCTQRLQGGMRGLVQLVYRDGLSIQQAANHLEITFTAAAKRLSRARQSIRACVEQALPIHETEERPHAFLR